MYPSYSVAIRTLGTAGEKYKKLLDSIDQQTIKPEKVVVVLPEGNKLPKEQLGYEQFQFSPKGMIVQRMEALKFVDSEYTLFCDDDVEFEADFSMKLIEAMERHGYSAAAGPLVEFFPPNTWKHGMASCLGGACVMLHGRDRYYTRILSTGGWSYNHSVDVSHHKIYGAESLAWTCFMVKTDVLRQIKFNEELWLDKSGYAAFEDRVMFYKLLLNGARTCVVSDAHYIHNDGKTSTREIKLAPIYSGAFNHYVFWHRFLYKQSKNAVDKLWKRVCINYYVFMSGLYGWGLFLLKRRSAEERKTSVQGFKDAKLFVKSQEYLTLPNVVKTKQTVGE